MCGRYTQTKRENDLAFQFGVPLPQFKIAPSYNIAPSQIAPVILNISSPELRMLRWGLVPYWAKDAAIGNKMINAQAETLASKPSFKKPLQSKRCLVASDGFYEWAKVGNKKYPVRILFENEALFAFAGLWDEWKAPDGEILQTFTIVTVPASDRVKKIHDRMPAILDKPAQEAWLDSKTSSEHAVTLLKPLSDKSLTWYPVSKVVNSPAYNEPDCLNHLPEEEAIKKEIDNQN